MAKYTAYFETTASASITIEVPDHITDPEAIAEYAYEHGPSLSLCAQCAGWRQPWSMDLPGEWETTVHQHGPHKGLAYVTDEDGNEVTSETAEES